MPGLVRLLSGRTGAFALFSALLLPGIGKRNAMAACELQREIDLLDRAGDGS